MILSGTGVGAYLVLGPFGILTPRSGSANGLFLPSRYSSFDSVWWRILLSAASRLWQRMRLVESITSILFWTRFRRSRSIGEHVRSSRSLLTQFTTPSRTTTYF